MAWFNKIARVFRPSTPQALLTAGSAIEVVKRTTALGTGGTAVYGGIPSTRETRSELIGPEKFRTYDDLKYNVEIIATALRRILTLVKGTTWTMRPADDSGAEGERIAENMEAILLAPRAMARPWPKIVAQQFMYVWDGATISEWIAKRRDDGTIGFADIQPRPMHTITRYDQERDGTLRGVWQTSPWDYKDIYLPRGRLVYAVDSDLDADSPEGVGRLRHLVEKGDQLKRLEQIEGWGFETDVSGTPVARIPFSQLMKQAAAQGIREHDKQVAYANSMAAGLRKFVSEHIVTPGRGIEMESATFPDKDGNPSGTPMFDLEILSSNITNLGNLNSAIERKVREMARLLGVEGLLLGSSGQGSYALSKDKTAALVQLITSGLDDLSYTFDHDLVAVAMALNGWDPKLTPTLVANAVDLRDVEQIIGALEGLARAGLRDDDLAIDEVRDMVGVSPAPEILSAVDAMLPRAPREPVPPGADEVDEDDGIPIEQVIDAAGEE